ncbi:unnamed protein product [Discosporangium mesarthrocarpum]
MGTGSTPGAGLKSKPYTKKSNGFFQLEEQPDRVAVVGAGYIAVELAGIFNALGSSTHLFVRGERALRSFDPMIAENLDTEVRAPCGVVHYCWLFCCR